MFTLCEPMTTKTDKTTDGTPSLDGKSPLQFNAFPKMARLSREVIITEKIDGTNAQVHILPWPAATPCPPETIDLWTEYDGVNHHGFIMLAGSRNRYITVKADNFGFAAWVKSNAIALRELGVGRHFGEWWGSGIQRGYDLKEKRFSLFNVNRWCAHDVEPQSIATADPRVVKRQEPAPTCCHVVPLMYRGEFNTQNVDYALDWLSRAGSIASPGYHKPEGVVVFHVAGNVGFKKTLENDTQPKGAR